MKKNKLYKLNKWNRPAFASAYGEIPMNLYSEGSYLDVSWKPNTSVNPSLSYGTKANFSTPLNTTAGNLGKGTPKSFFGNIKRGLNESFKEDGAGWPVLGAGASLFGSIDTGDRRGYYDTLDPLYHLANGRESKVGGAVGDAGVGVFQAGLSSGNPLLMGIGGGMKAAGSLIDAAFGVGTNKELLNNANNGIDSNSNFVSNANFTDELKGPESTVTNSNVYSGGWFTKKKARKKNRELAENIRNARDWAFRSLDNNLNNINSEQMNDYLANYNAFGGPLDISTPTMGAIDYGFMSDYLLNKRRQIEQRESKNLLAPKSNLFAIGGDLQVHGGDYSTGLTHVEAGGTHEENPNGGIPFGFDSQGIPNMVEEGETVFNDYVFSNRIFADSSTKRKFHLPKKKAVTFADISEKLEKESKERPNDPISKAGLDGLLGQLAEEQERQRMEMEASEARDMFNSLSPEEQLALMQRVAQEEQGINQAQSLQQAPTDTVPTQDLASPNMLSPYSEQGYNNQMAELSNNGSYACGGRINKFSGGGDLKTAVYSALGIHTDEDFKKWASANNIAFDAKNVKDDYWQNLIRNKNFIDTVGIDNSSLAHALRSNYDFGVYKPDYNKVTITDITNGNKEAQRNDKVANFVQDELGDWHEIQTEVPSNWKLSNTYNWNTDEGGITYNYYNDPSVRIPTALNTVSITPQKEETVVPVPEPQPVVNNNGKAKIRSELPRYIGLAGPAVGLGLWAAGIGKPDTSGLDAAISMSRVGDAQARYKPVYGKLTYNPLDIWYEQNRADANSRATDRAILNNNLPQASRMSGLLANGYNNQIASGDLYRKALEYNDAKREQVARFNRETDIQNANAFNEVERTNAQIANNNWQYRGNIALNAAKEKMDANAGWYNALYGNIGNLFKGISDLGTENARMNMIAENSADGVYGVAGPKTNTFKRYLDFTGQEDKYNEWLENQAKSSNTKANGGKLKRKKNKGLIF